MIKFFRKIRHDLLNKGKTIQYLKYAIGEIILVVIGILIALSINNKNAEISERKAEKAFYQNIKQQLQDDAQNIQGQISYNSYHSKQFKHAIELIELNDRSQKDSLVKMALKVTNYSDFDRQGNIYETMVNSGDIKLLQNTDIVERLRRLEETYIYINRMESIHFTAVMELVPYLMESIRIYTSKVEDEEFLYSFKSQNMFVTSLSIMGEKEEVYNRALNEINTIIELINKEIN